MSEQLPVQFTALAAELIRSADSWWRENRLLAPNTVRSELEKAIGLIARQPRIGSLARNVKLSGVRRIYLPTIKQYLYYHVLSDSERIEVVALWHARRGEGPPI
jgi:plasmid stabilization system protein ParE